MGCQRITPEMEAAIGVKLRAAALAGGHRGKLPPNCGPQNKLSKTSLKWRALECVGDGEMTSVEISERLGVKPDIASGVLSTLCGSGRLIVVRRISGRAGSPMNVYERVGMI